MPVERIHRTQESPLDLHKLKQELQAHLGDGLVTVVGSGLSCAEGLPGMGELADHLRAEVGPALSPSDSAAWKGIAVAIAVDGLEAALLKHPPSNTIEVAIASSTAELIATRERTVITEVFNGTRKLRLTRLLKKMLRPNSGQTIVTTNYDRLVEVAAEEADLGVDTLFLGQFAGQLKPKESRLSFCLNVSLKKRRPVFSYSPRAIVLKPHGSLDWYLRDGRPVRYGGDLPGATRLIITPGQNKFRNGYESPFDTHRERANRAIDEALKFLVLGYGFNDDHLETHLTPRIKEGKPTLMLTHSLSPKALQLAHDHPKVIALDYENQGGVAGTRVIHSRTDHFIPGLALWDVGSFVTEVLEP